MTPEDQASDLTHRSTSFTGARRPVKQDPAGVIHYPGIHLNAATVLSKKTSITSRGILERDREGVKTDQMGLNARGGKDEQTKVAGRFGIGAYGTVGSGAGDHPLLRSRWKLSVHGGQSVG